MITYGIFLMEKKYKRTLQYLMIEINLVLIKLNFRIKFNHPSKF